MERFINTTSARTSYENMVKLPRDGLGVASEFAALTGTTPWYPVGTYNLALRYAGVSKMIKVEVVHERLKGLEGALGVVGTNESVVVGPEISSVFEDHVAVLLSSKFKEECRFETPPKWRSFRIQNNDALREVLSGVVAYRLTLPNKRY